MDEKRIEAIKEKIIREYRASFAVGTQKAWASYNRMLKRQAKIISEIRGEEVNPLALEDWAMQFGRYDD